MLEKLQQDMANRYFDRRMKVVFVDRVCGLGIETFKKYLSYRYRDNCYYYSGYAIMGLKDNDYLVRGNISLPHSVYANGGYSHGWVEFMYNGQEYVFDSMCIGVVPKDEWYNHFKPDVKFKYSKKVILESILEENVQDPEDKQYLIKTIGITSWYTQSVYRGGILVMRGNKVKKFTAYDPPSG